MKTRLYSGADLFEHKNCKFYNEIMDIHSSRILEPEILEIEYKKTFVSMKNTIIHFNLHILGKVQSTGNYCLNLATS